MRLEEQVTVVTGASSGLGKAMANAFVSEGSTVVGTSRTETRLNDAVAEISNGPGSASAITADVQSWGGRDRTHRGSS